VWFAASMRRALRDKDNDQPSATRAGKFIAASLLFAIWCSPARPHGSSQAATRAGLHAAFDS
jgi:hypothetical protein